MSGRADYTPALGVRWLTPFYDTAIALLTRESAWRTMLAEAIDLKDGERLLDVGCGTGSLAVRLARNRPGADVHGIDPDPDVLGRAQLKAAKTGVSVKFHEGFLDESFLAGQDPFDVIASSLVFHQVPLEGKRELLAAMRRALKPGGRICVADYGHQRSPLMRGLFRATVQFLDGVADTQPNADGVLPDLLRHAGFDSVAEIATLPTATGSISILLGYC